MVFIQYQRQSFIREQKLELVILCFLKKTKKNKAEELISWI